MLRGDCQVGNRDILDSTGGLTAAADRLLRDTDAYVSAALDALRDEIGALVPGIAEQVGARVPTVFEV